MNDASMKQKIHFHFDSLMNSYAQVFFSQNKILEFELNYKNNCQMLLI